MHARVITAQVRPGKVDEVIQVFRESVLPVTGQQVGARQVVVLADRQANRCMLVALWDSEEALTGSVKSGYLQEQLAKFGDLLVEPPRRESYEVMISVGPKP